MARKTDEAVADFQFAQQMGRNAGGRIVAIDGLDSNLEEINARCMFLGTGIENLGSGLEKLAGAIKDVFDKLDEMDRRSS